LPISLFLEAPLPSTYTVGMQILVFRREGNLGPFTLEELRTQLAAGTVVPGDFAWHEGLTEWVLVSTLAPSITAPASTSQAMSASYTDRSGMLTIFGVATILLGCVVALFVPLMLFGMVMAAKTHAPGSDLGTMAPAMAVYGGLAVALIWMGIGTLRAERWARALMLIFSWTWLVMGIFITTTTAFVLPRALANVSKAQGHPMSGAMIGGMLAFMLLFYGATMVVLPAIWVFFYSGRNVKATCEARNLSPSWTDACPLPVLVVCLWLLFSALTLVIYFFGGHFALPFFGMFLAGVPCAIFGAIYVGVLVYCAWLMYRLDIRGWWLLVIGSILMGVSSAITFSQHDIMDMYRVMNYPQAQIDQIKATGLFTTNNLLWMSMLGWLPILGYVIFIKRYFSRKMT
jgi:hypothetical protein